jgi:hypothetical protein
MPIQNITMSDLLAGKVSLSLSAGRRNQIVVHRLWREFIEVADTLLRFNSAVVLPRGLPTATGAVSPSGFDVVATCLRYARAHPAKAIVIAGHTDTVGSDASNVKLSGIRAEAVHGLLVGNRDQFALASWGPHLSADQRYPHGGDGSKKGVLYDDYADVLTWVADQFGWPCAYPHSSRTLWQATKNFEDSYNASTVGEAAGKPIPSDGWFTKATWAAAYDCYQLKLAESLHTDLVGLAAIQGKVAFVNPDVPTVSCGEFKPIDQLGRDNYASQTNRRVEVLYFDGKELPNPPCFGGACDPGACDIYNNDIYVPHPVPLDPVGTGNRLRIKVALGRDALVGTAYQLWSGGIVIASGTTKAEGLVDEPVPGDLDEVVLRIPDFGLAETFAMKAPADFPAAATVTGAQVRLRQLGYYVGPIDGIKGMVTDDAIRNFKVAYRLADDADLDAATAATLTDVYGS